MLQRVKFAFLVLLIAAALASPAGARGIVGVWQGRMNDGSSDQVVFQGNGQVSQQQTYNVGGGSTQLFMSGRWTLVSENTLRINVTDYQPRQWCGPLGCQPIRYPEVIHVQFVLVDQNTIRLADGVLTRR
jgi:hypothetical protein